MQVHLAEHTVDVELVELSLDRLRFVFACKQTSVDDVDQSGPIDVESKEEVIGVHLTRLAVGLVEDGLIVPAESRCLTRLLECLQCLHIMCRSA